MILLLLVVATSISVFSATTFVTQTSSDATSPYVSIGEYRILSNVSNYLKSNNVSSLSTIFLVYPPERTYDPTGVSQWTNLYDNWILATVGDRKSTRLNSSHTVISYAVFCLKK